MLLVLILDGSGYLLAVSHLPQGHSPLLTGLSDIFVAVAMLTIVVALVLPGMIGHSAKEVSDAAQALSEGTLAEFSRAMSALGRGDLDGAHAQVNFTPVNVYTNDEVGEMAESFNRLQAEVRNAALGLDGAREGLLRARKQLVEANEDLAARADKLARTNAELEQFNYVASHDLQEPLQTITSFTQLLTRRFGGENDPSAREYVGYITASVDRMQNLIEGLLKYSRVTPDSNESRLTDMNEVVNHSISSLQSAVDSVGAAVTHDDLPTLAVNSTQIAQVLQNLIGNAIKFHGDQPPRIHISAKFVGGDWVFSIRDNGIGVPQQHSSRIFQLFQRLHNPGMTPGSGIGLAICKKIIEQHGGNIWVEPGNPGSVFRFTLPARETARAA
jgi:light-regulated signal transduction histidine kinase (bacteriophytochrome)